MTRVLVVDDELHLLRALKASLSARRYEAVVATSAAAALEIAAQYLPDLVILDLTLPDMDGLEVIAGLRHWLKAPILALCGRADEAGMISALDAGADDCVTKPFSLEELMARLRALQRRAEANDGADEPIVLIGHFSIDVAERKVTRRPDAPGGPEYVHLTKTEWAVLEVLVRNPGKLVSSKQIFHQVWGSADAPKTHHLRFHLAKLRHKLEPEPSHPRQLITEPGSGYRFQP